MEDKLLSLAVKETAFHFHRCLFITTSKITEVMIEAAFTHSRILTNEEKIGIRDLDK